MKIAKMSLMAALLLGSSAYAFENTNVSGDARFFYSTTDGTPDGSKADLFGKNTSTADAGARLSVTTDIDETFKMGVTGYAVSTFGLQDQIAANVWSGAHLNMDTGEIEYPSSAWVGEAWLEATFGKTTAKAGRMELDTPLVFTEQWGVAPNTFEAATLTNTDLPDTTIVAAWIDSGNGYSQFLLTDTNGKFTALGDQGAITFGIVNNSWQPLTVQGWYYNLPDYSQAYWLEADFSMDGIVAGIQYADMNPDENLSTADDSTALAFKIGYEGIENLGLYGSYSTTDKDGDQYIGNIATRPGEGWGMQSKLYTEAWWNFGYVGLPGTDAYNLTATYSMPDIADLGLFYTNIETDTETFDNTLNEVTFTAGKSFGKLDTLFAYIYAESDDFNAGDAYSTVQFYLTYNFQ
jgi:imipenem/basic amino acid-specific outer membrane pore